MSKRRIKGFIPLIIFLIIAVFLWRGLKIDPRKIPSSLIDKPAPTTQLATVLKPENKLTNADLKGQVSLVNVWATWCVSCREEHPILLELARRTTIPIYGLDYKDTRFKAKKWLVHYGNPYVKSGFDEKGLTAIDWGVYGTPETFVIDKKGIIRYKHIGHITLQSLQQELVPVIKRLQSE